MKIIASLPQVKIENSYGDLSIQCIQDMNGAVIFTSKMLVAAERVDAYDIQMVEEIQNQIKELNQYKLRFMLVEE